MRPIILRSAASMRCAMSRRSSSRQRAPAKPSGVLRRRSWTVPCRGRACGAPTLWLLVLSDEVSRRESLAVTLRVERARLDPAMRLETWDATAKVTLDRALLNELTSLRFLDAHAHVAIVGPVGVGKTFLAHALGHIACRRGASVLAGRTDQMLKTLKHARLDHSYEAELRKLIAVDLLILDDFAIDTLDVTESRDLYEILLERYRAGSIVVT